MLDRRESHALTKELYKADPAAYLAVALEAVSFEKRENVREEVIRVCGMAASKWPDPAVPKSVSRYEAQLRELAGAAYLLASAEAMEGLDEAFVLEWVQHGVAALTAAVESQSHDSRPSLCPPLNERCWQR